VYVTIIRCRPNDAFNCSVKIRRCSLFIIENRMYHNKLTRWGLLIVFITIAVGLIYNVQDAQFISSVKAASQALPDGDLSVVGKPTLPATTVDVILKDLGSPMSGIGQVVEQASQRTNIDDAFALAVWWTETNDGAAGVGLADRNPGSVRGSVGYPSAYDGYTIYPSYSVAIVYWFNMLKNVYVNQGLSTVYLISHPYVGTSSSPLWAGKVVALMLKYRGEAPPAPIVVPHGKRVIKPSIFISVTPIPVLQKQQVQGKVDKTLKNNTSSIVQQVNTFPSSSTTTYAIVFFTLLLALAIVASVLWLERQSGHKRDASTSTAPEIEIDTVKMDALVMQTQGLDAGENFRIRGKLFLPFTTLNDPAKSGELTASSGTRGRSTGLLSRYGETNQD
jgi:hypothetical protein